MAENTYSLRWNDYVDVLSTGLMELLRNHVMCDVTFSVDGFTVRAHRIILSAVSPYFRSVFAESPKTDHSIMLVSGCSKQIFEHIITFIYCGKVSVEKGFLQDFLNAAKLFKIKGLEGPEPEQNPKRTMEQENPTTKRMKTEPETSTTSNVEKPKEKLTEYERYYACLDGDDDVEEEDDDGEEEEEEEENEPNTEIENSTILNENVISGVIPETAAGTSSNTRRRTQNDTELDLASYEIVADIRPSDRGQEHLFYNGHKYFKRRAAKAATRWYCMKVSRNKCKATVSTAVIDGVTRMKILNNEHTHDSTEQSAF